MGSARRAYIPPSGKCESSYLCTRVCETNLYLFIYLIFFLDLRYNLNTSICRPINELVFLLLLMIKVKEYNFPCEIVKVDLSVGPTYSILATIKRANETGWGTFT